MPLQIALIGAGNISSTHARAVEAIPDAQLVGVYDESWERADRLAAAHNTVAFRTLDDLLTYRTLDMVIVGTPSGLHAQQGIVAAQHGLHVLVEKPIDITMNRATELIDACDRARVLCGVVLQERFQPANLQVKQLINEGALGRLLLISAHVPWYRPPEYYTKSSWHGVKAIDGGGALMNQGVHTVDTLLWLMGDVAAVHARTATLMQQMECEDTALAILEFASGAMGSLQVTTVAYPGYERRIQITGTEGTIILEGERIISAELRNKREDLVREKPAPAGERASSSVVSDISAHKAAIEAFVNAIHHGYKLECDGREGRRSLALVERIYEAASETN